MAQLSDRVGTNQLARPAPVGLIAQFVVDPGERVGMLFRCCHHLRRFKRIDGHRLFAQDVLPRLERRDREARVRIGCRRHDHEIHVRRARQLDAVRKHMRHTELARHGLGVGAVPARDRRGLGARHQRERGQLHAPGESGADDADPHVVGCRHSWKPHDVVSVASGSGTLR